MHRRHAEYCVICKIGISARTANNRSAPEEPMICSMCRSNLPEEYHCKGVTTKGTLCSQLGQKRFNGRCHYHKGQ